VSSCNDPSPRKDAQERLFQLTDEIEHLRVDLARKIDEAAEIMGRINSLDETSSHHPSAPERQDVPEPQAHRHRSRPPIVP
jgi:hypothetical protein